jgi:hypothetical protein
MPLPTWLGKLLSKPLLTKFARLLMSLLARLGKLLLTLMIPSCFKCLTVSNRISLFEAGMCQSSLGGAF